MIKVITAVEKYERQPGEVIVFLAGGITKCWEWQDRVIESLKIYDTKVKDLTGLVIANPRRQNFPINDPNASNEQITWEFNYLEQMDIFSMYFCGNTESDQPICFYELGRNIERMIGERHQPENCIITCESDFRRIQDVQIQTALVNKGNSDIVSVIDIGESRKVSADKHAYRIAEVFLAFVGKISKESNSVCFGNCKDCPNKSIFE